VAVLSAAALVETVHRQVGTGDSVAYTVLLCLLALLTTAPAALPWPTAAALVVTVAAVLSLAGLDRLTLGAVLALLVCGYRLGRSSGRRPTVLPLLLGVPFLLLAVPSPPDAAVTAGLLAGTLPVAAGLGMFRRLVRDDAESRAVREALTGAEWENGARRERARIARELHDIVAHHISMVAVQAESARLTVPDLAPAAQGKLLAIGDTARSALADMRRLLGVLRQDAAVEPAVLRPQPGLGQLTELIDEARDAGGGAVRLILSGPPVPVEPGAELAAYRIVQESLTNARRHAAGAAVDVELRYSADGLRIMVRDNGFGSSDNAGGHGLTGMRERAAAVGGRLRAGPADAGGFLVEAVLPAVCPARVGTT